MELKDFISQTLIQIMVGINNAQENTNVKKALISPNLKWGGTLPDRYYYEDER